MSLPPSEPAAQSENSGAKLKPIYAPVVQSSAVLSGLLAALAAQLLSIFKDDSNFKQRETDARAAILAFTYIALMSSIFATVASVVLTMGYSSINISSIVLGTAGAQCVYLLVVASACIVTSILVYLVLEEALMVILAVFVIAGAYIFLTVAIPVAIRPVGASEVGSRAHVARAERGRE